MFDYSLLHWTTFLTAALLLSLSPGPDIAFILGQSIKGGKLSGYSAMFGIWTGTFVHVLLAAVGLSAVIATSAVAFSVVKWVGAFYLIWLGINAIRSNGEGLVGKSNPSFKNNSQIYKQGVLISMLNPKVAIFFLAFLPQFIVDGAGPVWMQLSLHGFLVIIVAGFVEPPLVILATRLTKALKSASIGKLLDRGLGALFITLGVRLALTENAHSN